MQNITSKYNKIFKDKGIYLENIEYIPDNLKLQAKLYQIAIKRFVDLSLTEYLEKVNLDIMQKVYSVLIKSKNVKHVKEYYIKSLINELSKLNKGGL